MTKNTHFIFIYGLIITLGLILYLNFNKKVKVQPNVVVVVKDTVSIIIDSSKTHDMFLDALGKKESGNKYDKVNSTGKYLGKYQFSQRALKSLDIDCSVNEFLKKPKLQEEAIRRYLLNNKKILSKYIGEYQFTKFRGVYITESGVLAASHLGGISSVQKFFNGDGIYRDGSGVPITKYMEDFAAYNLEF